jgi:4-alpha-glucanotransferase
MKIFHNSQIQNYKYPFGAVSCGTEINLRIFCAEENNGVEIVLFYQETKRVLKTTKQNNYYIASFNAPEEPCIIWYYFTIKQNDSVIYYCDNPDNFGGIGQIKSEHPNAYQITVYNQGRTIPKWYTEGIMYQIFVDRFCKGESKRSLLCRNKALYHSNWHDTPHYFRESDGHIEYWDFFGGNFEGIIEKLDYLKSLNVTVLYLNPVFESSSNHKYDTGDFYTIAQEFGNLDLFQKLCMEASKRNIRIILDGVFNHTGDDSIYFNRYGNYDSIGAYQSTESQYYSWYDFIIYPDEYQCWWGVTSLPNVKENQKSYQDFVYSDDNSVINYWIDQGISGWRLDVADELPDFFIRGIKKAMMNNNPETVLIGEVWEDASRKISYDELRDYFSGYELDSVMNYPFRSWLIDFLLNNIDSNYLNRALMSIYEHYPLENFMGNMNLIGSHDRPRILSVLGNAPMNLPDDKSKEEYRLSDGQRKTGVKRLKLIVAIQMTFPGIPCIYYGDEAGVEGLSDPYNRGTYPWGQENIDLVSWYRKISGIRYSYPVFQKGTFEIFPSENIHVFGFIRKFDTDTALCLFNRFYDQSGIIVCYGNFNTGTDLITGKLYNLHEPVILKAFSPLLLLLE